MAKISINIAIGEVQQKDIIVGIDLGTTNSLVAFVDPEGNPRVINDAGKGILVPSVIHFLDEKTPEVGNEAKVFLATDPNNTIFSIKRLLGRSFRDVASHQNVFSYSILDNDTEELIKVRIGNTFYTPIELSSIILKELKTRAEHSLKTTVKKAVITVPAYFNDSQRQATKDAGKLAGLEVLRIVNEPTAASLAYGIGLDPEEQKTIAVYDLGGGTFDVSILQLQNGIFEVLATHGDTYLGGDDFDLAIVNYWIKGLGIEPNKTVFQKLRLKAEEAKKALNIQSLYNETVDEYALAIDRTIFQNITNELLEKTLDCCKKAIQDAKIGIKDLDEVILVGGSTRMIHLIKAVESFFERAPNTSIDPDQAVALGAALQADILAGNRKDLLLLDVTPLSLGIETMGGLMDTIIPRNSKVPTRAGRQYTTSVDGQINMQISVFQGERDLVHENRKLAEFTLSGIPAMPAGLPKIDINFMLNADGILKVEAIELRSGISQEIEVKPTYGLTDAQVEQMLLDSFTHAQSDVTARMLLEAQTEGKQMSYTAQRFIEKHASLLAKDEIMKTQELINLLEKALTEGNKNVILGAIDHLNQYTKPFAERVMDSAISQAMKGKKIE